MIMMMVTHLIKSQSYHTVLPATRHRCMCPALTQAKQATEPVLDLPTPERRMGELADFFSVEFGVNTECGNCNRMVAVSVHVVLQ